jgi:hypothetical protein
MKILKGNNKYFTDTLCDIYKIFLLQSISIVICVNDSVLYPDDLNDTVVWSVFYTLRECNTQLVPNCENEYACIPGIMLVINDELIRSKKVDYFFSKDSFLFYRRKRIFSKLSNEQIYRVVYSKSHYAYCISFFLASVILLTSNRNYSMFTSKIFIIFI